MEESLSFKENIKISVIMLVYNREKYVKEAVESIINQNFDDFEFIIINNGSMDSSGEIVKEIIKNDSRVRYLELKGNKIGAGRNKGLDLAQGEYVLFVDDDDIAEPDMLSFLYSLAIEYNADISICGSNKLIDGNVMENFVYEDCIQMNAQEAVVEMLKREKYNVAMPTKMIRKSLFKDIRFLEDGNYDDITVGYKYLANANKVVANGIPKYCFRRHSKNNSAFTTNDNLITPEQLNEYIIAFQERTKYLSGLFPEIANYVRYSEWSYMISMCNKIKLNNLYNCELQFNYFKKILIENYEEFYNSEFIKDFEKKFAEQYLK